MRIGALVTVSAAALVLAGTTGARTDQPQKASLRLVSFDPVVIRGAGFASREAVRVDLSGAFLARRRTVATATGSLSVRFADVHATRCDVIRVVAVGSRGTRAGLKSLPSPMCMPA